MELIKNYADERVVKDFTLAGVTLADMYFMSKLYKRVSDILVNHLMPEEKKIYLTDDELYDILSVLDTLTQGHRTTLKKSAFEETKEIILKSHEELKKMRVEQQPTTEWDDEAVAEQTSTF